MARGLVLVMFAVVCRADVIHKDPELPPGWAYHPLVCGYVCVYADCRIVSGLNLTRTLIATPTLIVTPSLIVTLTLTLTLT